MIHRPVDSSSYTYLIFTHLVYCIWVMPASPRARRKETTYPCCFGPRMSHAHVGTRVPFLMAEGPKAVTAYRKHDALFGSCFLFAAASCIQIKAAADGVHQSTSGVHLSTFRFRPAASHLACPGIEDVYITYSNSAHGVRLWVAINQRSVGHSPAQRAHHP